MARKKKSSLGCLFYMALVLLVIVVFLFQWDTVQGVMERTGFLQALQNRAGPGGGNERRPAVRPAPPETSPSTQTSPSPGTSTSTPRERPVSAPEKPAASPGDVVVQVLPSPEDTRRVREPAAPLPAGPDRQAANREAEPRVRKSRVFFVAVDADGTVDIKGVLRSVEYRDAPLRATLDALMSGPTPAELNQGLFTAIPTGSKLNNLYVQGDTAFLDFNEGFRFNTLGTEGLKVQLKQLVYSATEFTNVRRVQFLIDGRKIKFLGPEGAYIGEPLTRDSFRN